MINEAAIKAFLDKHRNVERKSQDDTLFYEFPKDTTRVLIQFLPPVHNNILPGILFYQHWLNMNNVRALNCLKSYDLVCPFCDLIEPYRNKMSITEWESKVQSKVNVLILQDTSYESRYQRTLNSKTPHVLSMPGDYLLIWLSKSILEKDPNTGGDFTNPDNSFAWIFEREKMKGKFKRNLSPIPRKIGETPEEQEAILSKACDFKKLYKVPDDVYVYKLKESALYLKEVIENKLIVLSNPGHQMLPHQNSMPHAITHGNIQQIPGQAVPQQALPQPGQVSHPVQMLVPQALPPEYYQQQVLPLGMVYQPPVQYPQQVPTGMQSNPPAQVQPVPAPVPMPQVQSVSSPPPAVQAAPSVPSSLPIPPQVILPQPAPPVGQASPPNVKVNPPNAPQCFGNKSAYNDASEICQTCMHEFYCRERIAQTA